MSASIPSPEYIKIHHAHRQFMTPEGGIINALDNISLSIAQSEFITLLGPSGCGKTTLLKIIAGFEELDSGDILLDGQSIIQQPAHKRPVNTVFQSYALFPHMTVGDNVGYGLDIAKVNKVERNQRVAEALTMVGLSGIEQRLPSQLSGGQQQRVALARAIINRPKLLLLDEPLSALDKNLRLQMQLELKNLQTELGICFIFVTHDQEEALTMSDQIVVLNSGKIDQIGTPDEIYHTPKTEFVARFIGESNILSGMVISKSENGVNIDCNGCTIFSHDQTLKLGEEVKLLLRPEHLSLTPNELEGPQAQLTMTLNQTVFVGSDYQLHGELSNGLPFSALTRKTNTPLIKGQQLTLYYQVDALHTIPAKQKSIKGHI
ncbi:ABC transporter ATP-binding protein [Marinomonas posidonica]|uniref:Spermidine/putrescine import ATP-binding protein PotA n=1 Tax=Marinomonas posidonica (strain CECT 7376 / NCIMB 14433 / IVIA-Po-181) TaxID=491952 RepID=F6CX51_MARPP|nr:ABC transporter ATP-binding protein [Marinomonas posidonica]AEF53305.1 spermidine/putrescine ABC transporter ATPase subunit [Marinomonas posidonica IVIA-Po-181]